MNVSSRTAEAERGDGDTLSASGLWLGFREGAVEEVRHLENPGAVAEILAIESSLLNADDGGDIPPLPVGDLAAATAPAQSLEQNVLGAGASLWNGGWHVNQVPGDTIRQLVSGCLIRPGGPMRTRVCFLVALLLIAASAAAQKPLKDFAGVKDPVLFTRMPNFFLLDSAAVVDKQFDSYSFRSDGATKAVEGHRVTYKYVFDRLAGPIPSRLQIIRNYQTAALAIGGKVVHDDGSRSTIVVVKDGNETWAEIAPIPNGYEYTLTIVERKTMVQDVLANAEVFKAGLAQAGHVEVPGIYFDTAKADIKPESEAALKEVVKLLQANPAIKVWVVGHTDNTGAEDMNVGLSQARAASVVKALAQMGIPPARLAAHGAGPYAPVAENQTEAGRRKNRRVELVARQ